MTIVEDPVYLDEPLVKTTNLQLNVNATMNQYQAWLFCQADDEVPGRDPAWVPHFLPGKNPYLTEFAEKYHLPVEPTRGGKDTAYPEYAKTMKTPAARPAAK
jgi:hypothetical protein